MKKKFVGYKRKDFYEEWDKQFFKKDKVTTCVITIGIPTDSLIGIMMDKKELKKFIQRYPTLKFVGSKCIKELGYFVYTAKGKAVCSDEDEYDSKIGHNVADAKAEMKVYNFMSRMLMYIRSRCLNLEDKAFWASQYFDMCYDRENNFVSTV